MPDPRAVVIELSAVEREQLESWSRRRSSAQALAERSRIVLAAAEGLNSSEIARQFGINVSTARWWRNRFAQHRVDGLTDEPRPGQARKITDAQVEEVIVKTLETTPKGATHWSTRSMAREVGLTQSAVLRIWKAFGRLHSRHRAIEFKQFLATLDREVPDELGVHVVLDNSSTHKTPAIQKWLVAHPRFVLHFSGSSQLRV